MDAPSLQINQQRAQITIDIQNAQLHVDMQPRRMVVHHKPPEMTIHREEGSIRLDMKEFKSSLGLEMYNELSQKVAAHARVEAQEAIRDTVNSAAFAGDVASRGINKIGKLTKDKMLAPKAPAPDVDPVPARIDMEGSPGKMEIEWSDRELFIEWEGGGSPRVYVDPPYSVDIYIKEKPYVRISVTEGSIPEPAGRTINTFV